VTLLSLKLRYPIPMKANTILEWVATIVTIAGAFLTAFDYHPYNLYVLNAGSVLWLIWADEVVVMDSKQERVVQDMLNKFGFTKPVFNANVPDDYGYRDPVIG